MPEPEVKPEPVVNPPPHFEPNPWASMGPPEVDPWLGAKYPTGAGNVPVDTLDTSGSLTQTSKKKSGWSTDKKPTPERDAWESYRKEDHTLLQKAFPPSFFMDAMRSEVDEESSESDKDLPPIHQALSSGQVKPEQRQDGPEEKSFNIITIYKQDEDSTMQESEDEEVPPLEPPLGSDATKDEPTLVPLSDLITAGMRPEMKSLMTL